ncbi:nicotinamide riboside transporter PnuC [uncultured Clostridium sp.]|uniref:nicotinamide riboside transporter PnuC n=1 Tax=uncultured Clostridium sp. TaxID=59620 RepID=UPI0026177F8E|nr:nicotinamide riboside transporter PnuC [uncultured Clostridium sp.]
MKFFKELTLFQKIFFGFFLVASLVVFLLPLALTKTSISTVFSPLSVLGFFSVICGIFVSIYTAKAKPAAYVFWWGSTIAMAIICFFNGLYGQFIQNLFFSLPIQIYGFFAWEKNLKKDSTLEVKKMKSKNWGVLIVIMILFWIAYGLLLKYLPTLLSSLFNIHMKEDPQIVLDAFTAMTAIIASVLTDLRFIEQWYFWIVYNSVAAITFIIQLTHSNFHNIPMFIASLSNTVNLTQYIIGVVYGYIVWVKIFKSEQKEKQA